MTIPKILHHCWFGDAELPELAVMCLESWRRVLPDYRIMTWHDADLPPLPYIQTALKNRKFANVANYMRLHILAEYGGIYMDTDVEAVRSFDKLLPDGMFAGWQQNGEINNAVIGATPRHPLIQHSCDELPKQYDGLERANRSGPTLLTAMVFDRYGVISQNAHKSVRFSNLAIYPDKYFYPYWWTEQYDPKRLTAETVCVHHWAATWK